MQYHKRQVELLHSRLKTVVENLETVLRYVEGEQGAKAITFAQSILEGVNSPKGLGTYNATLKSVEDDTAKHAVALAKALAEFTSVSNPRFRQYVVSYRDDALAVFREFNTKDNKLPADIEEGLKQLTQVIHKQSPKENVKLSGSGNMRSFANGKGSPGSFKKRGTFTQEASRRNEQSPERF